jgi:6-pyruvoyltetrahydropterin/6-carboxytetrahydropterin synthase
MTTDPRPIVYLERQETFSAAHRLWSTDLTDEQNYDLFGPCAREHGHGHNYVLYVVLRGRIDPRTGILVNLRDIRDAIGDLILEQVDHRHLNFNSPLCHGINPTAENLTVLFWKVLRKRFGDTLYEVRLGETAKNLAFYRGD